MIELSPYEQFILELWYEAGTVSQGAAGLLPLEWDKIITWADRFYSEDFIEWVEHPRPNKRYKPVYTPLQFRQCVLCDSELKLIRQLSQDYSSEYSAASDPSRPCPKPIYLDEVTEDEALANARAMEETFKMFFSGDTST